MRMFRHVSRLFAVSMFAAFEAGSAGAAGPAATPNIVVILADDYGYGSAGCYGADPKLVRTPNIDRLAAEGRRFTDANTTSSVCSPTRYSLMTGRYCWRTSLTHEVLGTFSPLHIETNRLNMASLLKRHGYGTAAVGKWHLGYGDAKGSLLFRTDYEAELSPGPLDLGFDYHFGVPSNHGDLTGVFVENRYVYGLRKGKIPEGMKIHGPDSDDPDFKPTYTKEDTENGRATILDLDAPRRKNERVMKVLTDKATSWIERQPKDKPFFLYFTPVAVHNPVTPDADLAGKSAAGPYGDWIHELDRSVGRILESLDRKGAASNTLVIFTSDNGGVFHPEKPDMPSSKAFQAGLKVNGALRGSKHSVWEGGFKVAFLARWPERIPAGSVCGDMISMADILATTAELVGDPLPPAARSEAEMAAEDSVSFLPSLLARPGATQARTDMIVHSADGVFAVRRGPWKWIEGVPVEDIKPGARKARADEYKSQLYNTKDDPAETKDVSAAHPEVVKELSALLERYRNGGYSRAMPPEKPRPAAPPALLPPPAGTALLRDDLKAVPGRPWTATGTWKAHDEAVWGAPKRGDKQPAALVRLLSMTDGVVQFDLNFKEADRFSLRIHTKGNRNSFRIVVSPAQIELAKNPDPGQGQDQAVPLGREKLKLKRGEWYTLRVGFNGGVATAQIGGATVRGSHDAIAQPKELMNLLVFEGEAGVRNLIVMAETAGAK